MAYTGEVLSACGVIDIDFANTYVVAVSGDGVNVCGHLLLYAKPYYFHVAELRGYPRYMSGSGYTRYLKESGKTELQRRKVPLPNPQGALLYLEGLMSETWTWMVLPNNCVAFVEEVIKAGGGSWGSYSNCPALATAPTVSERIQSFYQWMQVGIYNAYGIPQM